MILTVPDPGAMFAKGGFGGRTNNRLPIRGIAWLAWGV